MGAMFIDERTGRSGSSSMELNADYRPVPDQIRRMLGLMDGGEDYAFRIFYVPDDAGWPNAEGFSERDW